MLRQWPLHEMIAHDQLPTREITQFVTDPFQLAINPLRITFMMVLAGHDCIVRSSGRLSQRTVRQRINHEAARSRPSVEGRAGNSLTDF